MTQLASLSSSIAEIESDTKYGPVGALYRTHGRCTCKNNGGWPSCSLCMDTFRCHGCEYCSREYTYLTGWHTLGPEWAAYHRFIDTARGHEAYVEAQRIAPDVFPPSMPRDEFLAKMVEQHLGSSRFMNWCVRCHHWEAFHIGGKYGKCCDCPAHISAWKVSE